MLQFAVEDRYAGIGAQSSCVDQAGRGLREAFCIDLRIEVVRCYFQLRFEAPLLAVWGTRLKKRRNWGNTFFMRMNPPNLYSDSLALIDCIIISSQQTMSATMMMTMTTTRMTMVVMMMMMMMMMMKMMTMMTMIVMTMTMTMIKMVYIYITNTVQQNFTALKHVAKTFNFQSFPGFSFVRFVPLDRWSLAETWISPLWGMTQMSRIGAVWAGSGWFFKGASHSTNWTLDKNLFVMQWCT